jgi:hypothetical protein
MVRAGVMSLDPVLGGKVKRVAGLDLTHVWLQLPHGQAPPE